MHIVRIYVSYIFLHFFWRAAARHTAPKRPCVIRVGPNEEGGNWGSRARVDGGASAPPQHAAARHHKFPPLGHHLASFDGPRLFIRIKSSLCAKCVQALRQRCEVPKNASIRRFLKNRRFSGVLRRVLRLHALSGIQHRFVETKIPRPTNRGNLVPKGRELRVAQGSVGAEAPLPPRSRLPQFPHPSFGPPRRGLFGALRQIFCWPDCDVAMRP